MPTTFGDVLSIGADGSTTVRLMDGREITIARSQFEQFGAPGPLPGTRLRIALQDSEIRNIVPLGALSPQPDEAGSDVCFLAHITSLDRVQKVVNLETPRGPAQFSPTGLSSEQWQRLIPGSTVTVHRADDGNYRLSLPLAQPAGTPKEEQAIPVLTKEHEGTIAQITPSHVLVSDPEGRFFGFMRHQFPGLSFTGGDRVTFRAIEQDSSIVAISILERSVSGFGGSQPCGDLLRDLLDRTRRPAIKELAHHFCSDKRLDWYWITPAQPARLAVKVPALHEEVLAAIREAEPQFQGFYSHQAEALAALLAGKNVLVLTPTASGKTNCYNPAVFQAIQGDPTARALYVFPLNALLNDQLLKLQAMGRTFERSGRRVDIQLLIGGMSRDERDHVLADMPQIVATNPEMLSWSLEWFQRRAPGFFRTLRYVVIDEVHTYRSLLGLHMAGLLRRLIIACHQEGNVTPQFVLSSATVGAPEELATRLTSLPLDQFTIIGESADGSAHQQRHWMMLSPYPEEEFPASTNPHDMHLHQAALALVDLLTLESEELNAILFAKSIRDVHFVHRAVIQHLEDRGRKDLTGKVKRFAGAVLSNHEKEIIYKGLRDGPLRAVVSTNALEAGIDIGALDVCIIAGFPFQVMRLRQMAGRAGRRNEGAVIFVPDTVHAVDRYYQEKPDRLLRQPAETFVIDHENQYIARKHILACAATTPGGVQYQELASFGGNLDAILEEARADGVIQTYGTRYTATGRGLNEKWSLGNFRSSAQVPYVICKAPIGQERPCEATGCTQSSRSNEDEKARYPHLIQIIDQQYAYRDAHPGAVYEDRDGCLHSVRAFDDQKRIITVETLPENTRQRTFAAEDTTIDILHERARQPLGDGSVLAWGDVRVVREYSGYFQYDMIPVRRCPACDRSYDPDVRRCESCQRPTRPHLTSGRPQYVDFPQPYHEVTYTLTLETVACWLALPPGVEKKLEAVSPCKIRGRDNRVAEFLRTAPPFRDPPDLARVVGLSPEAATAAFEYFEAHNRILRRQHVSKGTHAIYPAYYGQCVRSHLRKRLPEDEALRAFNAATGYPVVTDLKHICRNCAGGLLLSAAHTLEHLIALRYPIIALGDIQDLGCATEVLHAQTGNTTVFWYDNYNGGIGAAEKIYGQFDALMRRSLESMTCDCGSDRGCPICTQLLQCDRHNEALSKTAAHALLHALLGLPEYVPSEPIYWSKEQAEQGNKEAASNERARTRVDIPTDQPAPALDPCTILCVQPHVHARVLQRALEIRGEEIANETPPISIAQLQAAYQAVLQSNRPQDWEFPSHWTSYQILHVNPAASKRLAHSAYKTILRHVHPDVNPARLVWAKEVSQRVNLAWDQVKNNWAQGETGHCEPPCC